MIPKIVLSLLLGIMFSHSISAQDKPHLSVSGSLKNPQIIAFDNLEQLEPLIDIHSVHDFAWSPDGSTFLVADHYRLVLYTVSDFMAEPRVIEIEHPDNCSNWYCGIDSIKFLPDGDQFALHTTPHTIAIYDFATLKPVRELSGISGFNADYTLRASAFKGEIRIVDALTEAVIETYYYEELEDCDYVCGIPSPIFSSDNRYVIYSGLYTEYTGIIDRETGEITSPIDTREVVGFTTDGRMIISLGIEPGYLSRGVVFTDVLTGKQVMWLDFPVATQPVFAPDGSGLMAVSGVDPFSGPNAYQSAMMVGFYDYDTLIQAESLTWEDAIYRFWTGESAGTVQDYSFINKVEFSPDGKYLVSLRTNGEGIIWGVSP
ncbi:MAG: WD40 repeat domain-containing protein [Anaerolineaceae bacterium]|nr:WD40 repeat domain-containing protein [Anaerolineaceae bacterium]